MRAGNLQKRRVVVTGLGAISPLAHDMPGTWQALLEGRNGVGLITLYDASRHDVKIAAEIKDFDVGAFMGKREARRLDRFTQLADIAANEALVDSKLDLANEDTTRIGVVVGTGIGGITTIEEQKEILMDKGPGRITPFLIPLLMANAASAQVAIRHRLRGPNFCVVTACASAANSLGSALRMVQSGECDMVVAGGSEAAITPLGMAGFANMGALSKRNDAPAMASRPFDRGRDGFVMGEGAGILVLEELEHALKRDARIYCEFLGCGFSGDGNHITQPCEDGDGGIRAMRACLDDAGLRPDEISYINAHGTSTYFNDKVEAVGIREVLGEHAAHVPVSSTKSMTGHLLGAAGGLEAAVCALSLYHGKIHQTANLEDPDPECDLHHVIGAPRDLDVQYVLSNSLGFGGHNAVLAFGKLNIQR